MNPRAVFVGMIALAVAAAVGSAANDPIDWNRARALRQKQQQGGTLTPDERAYLQRAMEARRTEAPQNQRGPVAAAAPGAPIVAPADLAGLVPLTDMTGDQRYKGRDGGLYGQGRNSPPAAHLKAALAAAKNILPRNAGGAPAADGRVALLSVGMSNTTQEYSRFKELADSDPAKSRQLVVVDGAQGGQAAAEWVESADSKIWETVDTRLKSAGVTPAQVQVVWLKQANKRPTEPFPAHAKRLEDDLARLVQMLKTKFPHLQLVYLSSRTFGGYATTPLNPEPYAYEGAFSVRDLILRQVGGAAELNFDSARGAVKAPVLLWGPYLWANGTTPRKSDGFTWTREDFREDGTHPSATTGRDKVAQQLLAFFKSDPTAKPWFVGK